MFGNHPSAKWLWLLAGLFVANVAYYVYNNWGLVTVKAKDETLGEIIHTIEWQGWVKIYTNLPLDTKVTMYADHVPLAEAMETLAANVDVPAPPPGTDDGTRPPRDRTGDRPGGFFGNAPAGNPPANGTGAPGAGGPGAAGGPPGGRGGGFGRRAEWNLAFFVGPTAADVKQEIRQFEAADPDIDAKVYTYNTQMQMIADDTVTAAPDPHSQSWPGYKPADPSSAPAATASTAPSGDAPADPPANTPPTVQTYLEAFAQSANIWIMATGSWAPEVANPPAPDSSIIRAVENFVSGSHGTVTEALVLRAGRGGPRGGAAVAGGDDAWADRMRNAISGLPPDQQPDALNQLNQEIQFRKDLRALPLDQRRQKMIQHFAERMLYGDHSRLSPEKRAKMYQRMIAMREAAKAQK
jgi:hypothetical protein